MTAADILRHIAGLIDYRNLPGPFDVLMPHIERDRAILQFHTLHDAQAWARTFNVTLTARYQPNATHWIGELVDDGLTVGLVAVEHVKQVA